MIKRSLKIGVITAILALGSTASFAQNTTSKTAASKTAASKTCDSVFIWDAGDLALSKARAKAGDNSVIPALNALTAEADKALRSGVYSVTDKTKTPPSGSKQDYYSIGPYWWPDPQSKTGKPYIRRDGEVNPERADDSFDSIRLSRFAGDVTELTLAAYFTDDVRYANHAAKLIRAWFLNPDTRMNPNMNFAQAIPGLTDGRGIGIIDSYRFIPVIDSIGLLYAQGALSEVEMKALKVWFGNYAVWMITSDNGRDERKATNNHGIYYDVQLATFAAFSEDREAVNFVMKGVKTTRIKQQIDRRGRLPQELKRTRPFHYTAFTTQAFLDIADLGECFGEDLWAFSLRRGEGIRAALDFHAGYAGAHDDWPYQEIRAIAPRGLYRNLRRAARAYNAPEFSAAAAHYAADYATDISVLLYPDLP